MVMAFLRDRFVDDETDSMARDGETVRTRMILMDSLAGYRPGYVQLTDDQIAKRREARREMVDRAIAAWRAPGCDEGDAIFPLARDAARAAARDARQQMIDRVASAWRTDPSAAGGVESRLERERGRGATSAHPATWREEPPDVVTAVTVPTATAPNKGAGDLEAEVERRRAAEHAAFAERLQNAWKSRISHM
jgi:hypothetical protein